MPRKRKDEKELSPTLPVSKELLDQLVTGPMTPAQFETMFRGLKKAVLERALGAELTHHLGTEKTQVPAARNHRNGTTPKTVITDDGAVRLFEHVLPQVGEQAQPLRHPPELSMLFFLHSQQVLLGDGGRSVRGGSFADSVDSRDFSERRQATPDSSAATLGFRVVLIPDFDGEAEVGRLP